MYNYHMYMKMLKESSSTTWIWKRAYNFKVANKILMQWHGIGPAKQWNRTDKLGVRKRSCSATNMDSLCDEYCVVAQIQEEVKTKEDCIDQMWVKTLKHPSDWCPHIK